MAYADSNGMRGFDGHLGHLACADSVASAVRDSHTHTLQQSDRPEQSVRFCFRCPYDEEDYLPERLGQPTFLLPMLRHCSKSVL